MSMTQFAMVEELAFLVKDNLRSKHLVLSMEEAFVNFLQNDSSTDGVLELEPMDSYNRLLLHRLADIFGFAHESVGEGDERHLILERSPETLVPSILVSDFLGEYEEPASLTTSHLLLRRKEDSQVVVTKSLLLPHTLQEREAAYLAARQRIFSVDARERQEPIRQKPRNVPAVARRMIAHALGQRINAQNQERSVGNSKADYDQQTNQNVEENDKNVSGRNNNVSNRAKGDNQKCGKPSLDESSPPKEPAESSCTDVIVSRKERSKKTVAKDYKKEEHLGAAKRMFTHALGLNSAKDGLQNK